MIPSREFFREFYDDLKIKFDYHVKFDSISEEEENNDFNFKVRLDLDDEELLALDVIVKFSGGEMSGKLSSKHQFDMSERFNYIISKKQLGETDN
jgi:hypothetical protein